MKRFTFTLESLYGLRKQLERQALDDLAQELGVHARESRALAEAGGFATAARAAANLGPREQATAQDLVRREAFRERRERELGAAQAALARQDEQVEARRLALELAAHEREMLTRLRKRRHEEYRLRSARVEEAALGDIRRRSRAGGAT